MAKNIKVTLTLDDSQYKRKLRSANNDLKSMGGTTGGLMTMFRGLGPLIAAAFSVGAIVKFGQAIRESTKEIETVRNQLRLVTDGAEDLDRVMTLLTQTAINNRASFSATAELFTKLKISTDALGKSEDQVLRVTTSLSQALAVAGADAATTNSVIRQFGQAMASGTVRGDEFNSLVEGLGPALAIMAKETGVNVGKLREMSQAGELTADVMFEMLENSKALKEAFDSMLPTLDQLETALGDAFDRFLVKVGESTGVTETYKNAVIALTRELDKMAGTEGVLVNMGLDEIMESVEDGTVSATAAIKELDARIKETSAAVGRTLGGAFADMPTLSPTLTIDQEQLQALKNLRTELEAIKTAREADAEAAKAEADLLEEERKAREALLKPFQEYIKLATDFSDNDYRTEQEKINDRVIQAQQVLDNLREAFLATNEATGNATEIGEQYRTFLEGLGIDYDKLIAELAAAQLAQAEYNASLNDGTDKGRTYQSWLKGLLEDMVDFTQEQGFARTALDEAKKSFESGALTLEEYTFLLEKLNTILGITPEKIDPVKKLLEDLNKEFLQVDTLEAFLAMQERINELYRTGKIDLEAYLKLQEQLRGAFTAQDEGTQAVINGIEQLNKGISQNLADAVVNGKSLMEGLKDTFKSVITQMIAEAFRLRVVQPLLASIFGGSFGPGGSYTPGGGGAFGFVKGLFGLQHGGMAQAGRPYLVGERGPELFVPGGTGSVVPNQSMAQPVTYNINAVDAKSFKQLVASDPEFIFSVTQAGARRIPG